MARARKERSKGKKMKKVVEVDSESSTDEDAKLVDLVTDSNPSESGTNLTLDDGLSKSSSNEEEHAQEHQEGKVQEVHDEVVQPQEGVQGDQVMAEPELPAIIL